MAGHSLNGGAIGSGRRLALKERQGHRDHDRSRKQT